MYTEREWYIYINKDINTYEISPHTNIIQIIFTVFYVSPSKDIVLWIHYLMIITSLMLFIIKALLIAFFVQRTI